MNNERHWALADITVTGIDQTDIVLRQLPGTRLTGSVEFDGSSSGRPQDLSSVGQSLSAAGTALPLASTATAVVDEDGDFLFRSIAPGSYSLQTTLPGAVAAAGWTLKSAMLDGRDLADLPLSVEPGAVEIDDLEISFTDRAAAIQDIHAVDPADPAFLSQLVESGYTLTLREGDVVQQDLRVGGGW